MVFFVEGLHRRVWEAKVTAQQKLTAVRYFQEVGPRVEQLSAHCQRLGFHEHQRLLRDGVFKDLTFRSHPYLCDGCSGLRHQVG